MTAHKSRTERSAVPAALTSAGAVKAEPMCRGSGPALPVASTPDHSGGQGLSSDERIAACIGQAPPISAQEITHLADVFADGTELMHENRRRKNAA